MRFILLLLFFTCKSVVCILPLLIFNSPSIIAGVSLKLFTICERDFPNFYSEYKKGDFLLDEVVTRRIKMEDINEAIQDLQNGKVLGRMIIEIA